MNNVSLADVLAPQQSWDYFLYVIIIIEFILMALLFSGSLRDVILIAVAMICAVADKAYLFGFLEGGATTLNAAINYHTKESFLTYAARVAMFATPTLIITQTKISRAKPIAVLLAILSLVYMFARWFFQQFPEGKSDFGSYILPLMLTGHFTWVYARHDVVMQVKKTFRG